MKKKLLFLPLVLAGVALLGWVVMLLWNWVMPGLFTGSLQIDYWRALGLLVLCRILFGGFHGRHGHRHGGRERWQRWQAMTPEERAQFHKDRQGFCRPNKEPKDL
ncbi:hypothetical protein [Duganella sp. HH105]|uniref:hypothetical protein n=1 Tax=Duganella sp. HH105 TaxID=1781067 RepID=UPI000877DD02|nr:hypothetical protein [Duganella sp. HH105]OEZ60620.1 hypothetical protein DUGA6_28400 [Duganella sp. HH105]